MCIGSCGCEFGTVILKWSLSRTVKINANIQFFAVVSVMHSGIDCMHKILAHQIIWWREFCHTAQTFFNTALRLASIPVMLNDFSFCCCASPNHCLWSYFYEYLSSVLPTELSVNCMRRLLKLTYVVRDWTKYFKVKISKRNVNARCNNEKQYYHQ